MSYKYKKLKWNTKKSKVFNGDCDGNKPKFIGMYEDKDSLIGRNNDVTYSISKIIEYGKFVEEWMLEIDFRRRNQLLNHYNCYSLKFKYKDITECKERAESFNKEWNNYSQSK